MITVEEVQAIPAERVDLPKVLSDEETAALEGQWLEMDRISLPIETDRDLDVYGEGGRPLLKVRRNIIPARVWKPAYANLEGAATVSDNRGAAGGPLTDEEAMALARTAGGDDYVRVGPNKIRVVKNGTVSKVTRSRHTNGGIVGFFEDTPRQPFCRLTSFTQDNFKQFTAAQEIMRWVDRVYEALMPEEWAAQKDQTEGHPDFTIAGTSFSTVTVNKNFRTAMHYDKGDYEGGFGNLTVIRKGRFEGNFTCFPQYGVGVDVKNGDVLLMDVHQLHGNTPMKRIDPKCARLALVMYFRENIARCGSEQEELKKARQRINNLK